MSSQKPWGALTGVRPTKKARKLLAEGVSATNLPRVLQKDYGVKKAKTKLLMEVLQNQQIVAADNLVDFYVNIPICPTRCAYCSFISAELSAVKKILPEYINALLSEIRHAKQLVKTKKLYVRSVYVGGGTPTVLSAGELEMVLNELNFGDVEFTVECGRPDTINMAKLEVLKRHGVSRISINPQTFCQTTLNQIGRKHTIEEVFEAYENAKKMGFLVNMDLIAGLGQEKLSTFKNSLKTAIKLAPENITVHTLSIKKGSCLQGQNVCDKGTAKMVNYAYKQLCKTGYLPYYLYRQKHQLGNLENIGYCQPNTQCVFNVDSMEETVSILACGANAISKIVDHKHNFIDRVANPKFIQDYIARLDEMIDKKNNLFNK